MMVTLVNHQAGALFWKHRAESTSGRSQTSRELARIYDTVRELCAPLVTLTNKRRAISYIEMTEPHFDKLTERYFSTLVKDGTTVMDVLESATANGKIMDVLVENARDILGPESTEQLAGVASSFDGLYKWVLENIKRVLKGDEEALMELSSVPNESMAGAGPANICITAVRFAIDGDFIEWKPASLRLLVDLADEYMSSVEDGFIGRRGPDKIDQGELVDLDEFLDGLELPA